MKSACEDEDEEEGKDCHITFVSNFDRSSSTFAVSVKSPIPQE